MIKISIIIPSYNSYRTIEQTLQAFDKQSNPDHILEIIVVDSSDDEKTKLVLSKYSSEKIRLIDAGRKVIPAIGRNIGAKEAKGDILVFIDSDAFPEQDYLQKIAAAFNDGCLVGGGSIDLPVFQRNKMIPAAQFFLQFNEFMNLGSRKVKQFVPSCNLFCEKNLFEKIGGFPEIRASEDTVFGLKASQVTKLWFIPEAKVYHIFREDFKSFLGNQVVLGKYILIYRRSEFKDKFYYKGLFPLLFLPFFLLIKLLRITGRVLQSPLSVIGRYLWSFPVFVVGLLYWAIGFAEGVFHHEEKY